MINYTNKGAAPTPSEYIKQEIIDMLTFRTVSEMTESEYQTYIHFFYQFSHWYSSSRAEDWRKRVSATMNERQRIEYLNHMQKIEC